MDTIIKLFYAQRLDLLNSDLYGGFVAKLESHQHLMGKVQLNQYFFQTYENIWFS